MVQVRSKQVEFTWRRAVPFAVVAVAVGMFVVMLASAASPLVAFEAEGGILSGGAKATILAGASGGSVVSFGSAAPTPAPTATPAPTSTPAPIGGMPTRANTGPRYALTDITPAQFYVSRTCNRQRIVGDAKIEQVSMRGLTFNLTDCEITGNMSFYLINNDQQLPADQMPIMNIAYTDILGGINSQNAVKLNVDHSYIHGRVQMKLTDGWPITRPGYAPYVFTNSILYNDYAVQPTHTETLQTAGRGTGTSFTNVVFMQQGGPVDNTGVTAVINYEGDGTIFDSCYFLWDGAAPAWYTLYISGPGVVVRNSWFDAANGGYIYPNSPEIMPVFSNNRNFRTNQLLSLP